MTPTRTCCRSALALVVMVAATSVAAAAEPTRSPARVELLTVGPGRALATRFGHAALCVFSATHPHGECFNYGATRARADLARQIVLGRAWFVVKREPRARMLRRYVRERRDVYSQTLPLDPDALARLAAALRRDSAPQHRDYLYQPFTDNCSTRIRDVIDAATHGRLRGARRVHLSLTYRRFVRDALADHPMLLAALDATLGPVADRPLSAWGGMFAPHVLRQQVAQRLDAPAAQLHTGAFSPAHATRWRGRLGVLALAALLLVLVGLAARAGGYATTGAVVATGVLLAGLFGLMATIAASSDLSESWPNHALFVVLPTDAAIAVLGALGRADRPAIIRLLRRYLELRLALCAATAVATLVGVTRQPLLPLSAVAAAALLGAWVGARNPTRWRPRRSAEPRTPAPTRRPRQPRRRRARRARARRPRRRR